LQKTVVECDEKRTCNVAAQWICRIAQHLLRNRFDTSTYVVIVDTK